MNFFMYVKYDAGVNELFNFENIYRSMITLFPMCTSAGWSNVLEALTNDQPPYCDDTMLVKLKFVLFKILLIF